MLNKRKVGKGQIAFEFLVIYGIFMVAFIAAVYIAGDRALAQQSLAESVFAREIGLRFAQEINIASRFTGYKKNYSFPETIRGVGYNISIANGTIILEYGERATFFYPLVTNNVTYEGVSTLTTIGNINITKGWMMIENEKGIVDVRQQ